MQASNLCFICSNCLLLHIRKQEKYWYCDRCHEHFSESFQQQVYSTNRARLRIVEQPQPNLVEPQAIPEILAS